MNITTASLHPAASGAPTALRPPLPFPLTILLHKGNIGQIAPFATGAPQRREFPCHRRPSPRSSRPPAAPTASARACCIPPSASATSANDIFMSMGPVVLTYISLHILPLSKPEIGNILGLVLLLNALTQPLFGWLADRSGGRWIGAGGVAWTLTCTALAHVRRGVRRAFALCPAFSYCARWAAPPFTRSAPCTPPRAIAITPASAWRSSFSWASWAWGWDRRWPACC